VLVIGAFTALAGTLGNVSSTFVAVDQHTTFLDDYFSFLAIEPLVPVSRARRRSTFRAHPIVVRQTWRSAIRAGPGRASRNLSLSIGRRAGRAGRRERRRQEHAGQAAAALLRPDRGRVRVGGVDLRDLDPEVLRSHIGVLFQDYASYEFSVRENVVMGARRPVDDERVMTALRDARSEWLLRRCRRGSTPRSGAVRRRARSVGRRMAAAGAGADHVPRRRRSGSSTSRPRRSIPKRRRRSSPS
jgi:ABC-type multidrug transport system fused ATPase/permease subunit